MPPVRVASAPAGSVPAVVAARPTPLYESVLDWVSETLADQHEFPRPFRKRLALLVAGAVASDTATLGALAGAIHGLAVTSAKEESIARRLLRLLEDDRLDPATLLPAVFGARLPEVLAPVLAAHAANERAGAAHHRRFREVRLVLDETSQDGRVHLLVVGLAYRGVVLPLGVRYWRQNAPLPTGEYWAQLGALLWEVAGILPPELRDHVLLLADRAYGVPRMLDLLRALGWAWVLRVQGQVRLQLPDGTIRELRSLVARPGDVWLGAGPAPDGPPITDAESPAEPAVFKAAGWRQCQVVAVWAVGEAEPWLLLTSLPPTRARVREYAQRWQIERLFLCWKSHGWNLEANGLRDPDQVARLVSGLALATLWRLALALPVAADHLADLAARPPRQLPLPLEFPSGAPRPARPWPAKFSLFTWGAKVARHAALRVETPAVCWRFPDWDAPVWSEHCRSVYDPAV